MDINALLTTLLSEDSVSGVAAQAGVKKTDVKNVLGSALPMLLNGANAQSNDEATAESFKNALTQHAQSDTSNIAAFLSKIDKQDGAKIIAHLLGSDAQTKTAEVSQKAGITSAATGSILSSAAPLLMSLLGQQTAADANKDAGVSSLMGALLGGDDMTSLIGGLLGANTKKSSGLGILGKLFGRK